MNIEPLSQLNDKAVFTRIVSLVLLLWFGVGEMMQNIKSEEVKPGTDSRITLLRCEEGGTIEEQAGEKVGDVGIT